MRNLFAFNNVPTRGHWIFLGVLLLLYSIASMLGFLFMGPKPGGEITLDFSNVPFIIGGLFIIQFGCLSTLAVRYVRSQSVAMQILIYGACAILSAGGTFLLGQAGLIDKLLRLVSSIRKR